MSQSISIVIPHLNQPHELEACLNSLAPQIEAKSGSEVIVIDNGSRQLPKLQCEKYPWVTLVEEATPGPGPARNRGIAAAKGQILAFIDADCVAHPDWIKAICSAFADNNGAGVLGGDVRILYRDAKRLSDIEAYESIFAFRQQEYITRMGFSGTGNLAMRRAVYDAVGPFAGIGVAEDRDWGRRATAKGIRIHYRSNMIVYHPARTSFGELARKWDRHVDHDYAELRPGISARIGWLLRAIAVAVSGIIDQRKIWLSDRLVSAGDKWLAAKVLCKIRLYRTYKMCTAIFGAGDARRWNRG